MARVIDGDRCTSWYPVAGECSTFDAGSVDAGMLEGQAITQCANTYVRVTVVAPVSVKRVRLWENRDPFPDGHDVLRGNLLLKNAGGTVLQSVSFSTTRPWADAEFVLRVPFPP
ncbi:MAG: hypothetical protein KBF88_09125 [Polyangiaceae bacterium]|nr:hypothetical protein [Polyangiaceae bacterium]